MALSRWKSYPVNLAVAYEGSAPVIQCRVFLRDSENAPWLEVFTTELTSEPQVLGRLEFIFHQKQDLQFVMQPDTDVELKTETSLASLLISRSLTLSLSEEESLHVTASELKALDYSLFLRLSGSALADKDVFSVSDPFFVLSANTREIYKSEVVQDSLNPHWKTFELSTRALCGSDFNKEFQLAVYDEDNNDRPELIGEASLTLNDLTTLTPIVLSNNGGSVLVEDARIVPQFSFVDYLSSGTDISVITAIDFTESSQIRSDFAPYEQVIYDVGTIIEQYDHDKRFVALGFGGSEVFALNGDEDAPEVNGVAGLAEAYTCNLDRVVTGSATKFAPLFQRTCDIACREAPAQRYYILLVLTDGDITDVPETERQLATTSHLPISVVIVGVGAGPFDAMRSLDKLAREGVCEGGPKRDIVQFVPYSEYSGNRTALTCKMLAEIPRQFLSFATTMNVLPNGA